MPLEKSYRVSASVIVAAVLLVSTGPVLHGICFMGLADAQEPPCSNHMAAPAQHERSPDGGGAAAGTQDASLPAHHECCALSPALLGELKAVQTWDSEGLAGVLVRVLLPAFAPQNAERWLNFLPTQSQFSASGIFLLHRVILR